MAYVDGFVTAVPAAGKDAYIAHAREALALFRKLGIIRMVECWGDDVPDGKTTDFRRAVKAEADEVVVLSWLEWPDKATRDAGMAAMMQDPALAAMPVPFDASRMLFGGFVPVLDG